MVTPHQAALNAGIEAQFIFRGEPVTYTDSATKTPTTVQALIGATPVASDAIDAFQIHSMHKDFIVRSAEMLTLPEKGDTVTVDTTGETYDVTKEYSEKHWTPHDPDSVYIRIHAKKRNT